MAKERLAPAQSAAPDSDFERFRGELLEHANEADQTEIGPAAIERLSRAFWAFGAQRAPGEIKIHLWTDRDPGAPRRVTVLEIAMEDRPFIVASVLAALEEFEIPLAWITHPIVVVERDAPGRRVRLVATRREAARLAAVIPGAVRESMTQIAFERGLDDATAHEIEERLRKVLGDIVEMVGDFEAMNERLDESVSELARAAKASSGDLKEDTQEAIAFLQWLKQGHFIFIGVRDYDRVALGGDVDIRPDDSSGLGVLRDPATPVMRRDGHPSVAPAVAAFLASDTPLIITKSNFRSTVHRRVYKDYVGVKRFGADGKVIGERRFVGLFTSAAYNRVPDEIPILRRKVRLVLERAHFPKDSHNYNALANILETYPRDELFQITPDELYGVSTGIMRLFERPRTRLFIRHDKFDRFVSALVFVPRDRYGTDLRERIGAILKEAYNGRVSAFYPLLGDGALVRVHFIIGRNPGPAPELTTEEIEARIVEAARSWRDMLHEELVAARGEDEAHRILPRFRDAFSLTYREAFTAAHALGDIEHIDKLGPHPDVGIRVYRHPADAGTTLRVKLYRRDKPISLSASLPVLEHMGLKVLDEFSYLVTPSWGPGDRSDVHVHDYLLVHPKGETLDLDRLKHLVEVAFPAIWRGEAESDGFNRLIVEAMMPWREVAILRAFARYLVQTGTSLSQLYMEEALTGNAQITRRVVDLFRVRFDPSDAPDRVQDEAAIKADILRALESVQSLDQDRILRRFLSVVGAILRTNYYQRGANGTLREALSFKLDSKKVEGLPDPIPFVEIFVYSPRVEGIHLRFGPVARGGLRWSDRREDFRTEVLGLVKAQYVKNAVIVPVGAKGGFVPKWIAPDATREERDAEGIACYKLFVSSLLELTDNLDTRHAGAPPIRPPDTICIDGPDPYLVVAADKGTATFSDIANGIAFEKGFWLGDAFASGGSQGYDHKAMGITARGAWEAVKRHFREIGTDIQTTPFRVIGVGDMSGDVFGNGMLLSRQIKLVAAFDHRDIFLDPSPDCEASFKERERLFNTPRSSWQDYDKSLISKGGGIFSRKLKSIPLTEEVRALIGTRDTAMAPADLIRALLTAETDLLWFGGIGTYIKARAERNADVGDAANDALRVDGEDVRAKVVGEGANLGCTQRGRIVYARAGGRINTDAIDNSAGVDTSDHEVNIKILLDAAVAQGKLAGAERNALLKEMTGDVARHVLADNYDQTLALSLAEATAPSDIDAHARFIRLLEKEGRLKRDVERLPAEEEIQDLKSAGRGLSRPELAVLMAYAKIRMFDELVSSDLPDDPALKNDLAAYFPPVLRERFAAQLTNHRLRREVVATVLANEVVNLGGLTFASRMRELTGAEIPAVVRAYVVAREVFGGIRLRSSINALDGKVDATVQTRMHVVLRGFVRRLTIWFLRNSAPGNIRESVEYYASGVATLMRRADELVSPFVAATMSGVRQQHEAQGVPPDTARVLALLEPLAAAPEIVNVAAERSVAVEVAARAQAILGAELGLERLAAAALGVSSADHWERLALRRMIDDLNHEQARLASQALAASPGADAERATAAWKGSHAGAAARVAASIEELEAAGNLTAARLSLILGQIRDLVQAAQET